CVVLRTRKGSSNYYGGQIALPVFKEVANRLYATKMKNVNTVAHQSKTKLLPEVKDLQTKNYNVLVNVLGTSAKINPVTEWISHLHKDTLSGHLLYTPKKLTAGVPDVLGMGLKDAVYILEKAGLRVYSSGKGKVTRQSIGAGTPVQKGKQIQIELS
ncbi:MAG TPA: PASTA domain-containing protein, partial [Chitinophagaceae bacterium]|nr:PASTA domain-containing protein [Chitinophagaceae bacterium]